MALNLERFRHDLDRLIEESDLLAFSMRRKLSKDGKFDADVKAKLGEHAEAFLKRLPEFNSAYEAWYSESLALLRQLLPDRIANFVSLYERPKSRKEITAGNYVIQDYLQGISVTLGAQTLVDPSAALTQFQQQRAIIRAAKKRFESSLFEIRQMVQADIFDDEISAARELLGKKFMRAAGAIAGVVLEKHLLQVCGDHTIKVANKNPCIADLNDLLKAVSVIDIPQWRHISLLGDLRNLCVHNKQKEPTSQQVADLIDGADKILKTIS